MWREGESRSTTAIKNEGNAGDVNRATGTTSAALNRAAFPEVVSARHGEYSFGNGTASAGIIHNDIINKSAGAGRWLFMNNLENVYSSRMFIFSAACMACA